MIVANCSYYDRILCGVGWVRCNCFNLPNRDGTLRVGNPFNHKVSLLKGKNPAAMLLILGDDDNLQRILACRPICTTFRSGDMLRGVRSWERV